MRQLIVTADDFGLAEEVNAAVAATHRAGILSAASLMVGGAAAADAVSMAKTLTRLRVGLHLALVDAAPTLSPDRIDGLVDRRGWLRRDMARLALELVLQPELRRQLRSEIAAQFEAYRRSGLPLDHVDVHKHFHLHPVVLREIIAVGRRFGMRAMRLPVEPRATLLHVDRAHGQCLPHQLLVSWASVLRTQARRAGLLTPDFVFGLAWSGAMTRERVRRLIQTLPEGLVEIYTHPATTDRFRGHAHGYCYVEELEALRAPETISAVQHSGWRLGGYADALAGADTIRGRHPEMGWT